MSEADETSDTVRVLEFFAENPAASTSDAVEFAHQQTFALSKGTISSLRSHALFVIRHLKKNSALTDDFASRVPNR